MPVTLRLRKADLEVLATVDSLLETADGLTGKQMKAWSSLYERVLTAEMRPRKSKPALSVVAAIECFRGVLGKRLVVPAGNPGPSFWAPLQNRINASGLTPDHCTEAARAAGFAWKGPIKAESIIRQADVLLSEAGALANVPQETPQEVESMTEL